MSSVPCFSRLVLALPLTLALAACVDTTDLSTDSSRGPHPSSNAHAVVIVEEFSDLQCPACRAAHEHVTKPLVAQYGARMRFEFLHFPLRSIHRYALDAAEAAECAADQGKFWEFVDLAYAKQPEIGRSAFDEWGQELKLVADLYARCRKSHIKRETVLANYAEGEGRDVRGTPTYFVNGERVESTVEAIGAAIDAALSEAVERL